MAAKENLFPLKMLVFSLGALLFGGLIFLTTLVIDRKAGCEPQELDLSEYGQVLAVSPDGKDVNILLKNNNKFISMRVDACTGDVRQRMMVTGK